MQTINLNSKTTIFLDDCMAVRFLIEYNIIKPNIRCICNNIMNLKYIATNRIFKFTYYCIICSRKSSLLSNSVFKNSNMAICDILNCIYMFILNIRVNAVFNICDISIPTYITLKKKLIPLCSSIINCEIEKIGGEDRNIQMDEMAFRAGQLIRNPTSDHFDRETIWIVGGILEGPIGVRQKFFLKITNTRTTQDFVNILLNNVKNKTNIKTDGWASYQSAIRYCNEHHNTQYSHEVVNHNQGFVNEFGTHTNTIEGFWSHLRQYW